MHHNVYWSVFGNEKPMAVTVNLFLWFPFEHVLVASLSQNEGLKAGSHQGHSSLLLLITLIRMKTISYTVS